MQVTLSREALIAAGLQLDKIEATNRPRNFVHAGDVPVPGAAFPSRLEADEWIMLHRKDLDWRAGYVFRLKGLRLDIAIVDTHGKTLT